MWHFAEPGCGSLFFFQRNLKRSVNLIWLWCLVVQIPSLKMFKGVMHLLPPNQHVCALSQNYQHLFGKIIYASYSKLLKGSCRKCQPLKRLRISRARLATARSPLLLFYTQENRGLFINTINKPISGGANLLVLRIDTERNEPLHVNIE